MPFFFLFQGHVFCFTCIHEWTKKVNACPSCRVTFVKITKTLSPEDVAKEKTRKQVI